VESSCDLACIGLRDAIKILGPDNMHPNYSGVRGRRSHGDSPQWVVSKRCPRYWDYYQEYN